MTRLLWPSVITALIIGTLVLSGCGGGGGGTTPVVPDTGTIAGRVLRADDTTQAVAGAEVLVQTDGATVTARTDTNGNYTLAGVPVGEQTVVASAPTNPNLRSQQVPNVSVTKNATTTLNFTLLGQAQGEPTSITLSPTAATIDLNGEVKFAAAMAAGSTAVAGTPTYYVLGNVGTISASGSFIARAVGQGQVWAVCGSALASATITVTPSRPPEVTTFLASPEEFTASGGTLNVTVATNDGDGIADGSVVAEIYAPSGDVTRLPMPLAAGTERDGTYRLTWTVPANSNTPNAAGVQAEMDYSLRVVVTDRSGAVTTTDFVDFVVKGLAAPPGPF